jgi:phage tail tube protein FII
MRHLLRGFTMWVGGVDYGYECEELQMALPDEVYTDHNYGGAVMTSSVPMIKIASIEPTFKLASHNPLIQGMLLRPPGVTDTFTFRAALIDESDGRVHTNVIIYEGRLATPAPDAWSREDAAGNGFTIKSVKYFRYEIDNDPIHEIGMQPAIMRINRIDLLQGISGALGR